MEKFGEFIIEGVLSLAYAIGLALILTVCFDIMHDGYAPIPALGFQELLGASLAVRIVVGFIAEVSKT